MLMPYLDLLLRKSEFEEILNVVKEVEDHSNSVSLNVIDTILMAAHMRIGSHESLAKAREIVRKNRKMVNRTRQGAIFVTFLCKHELWKEAYLEVDTMRVKTTLGEILRASNSKVFFFFRTPCSTQT